MTGFGPIFQLQVLGTLCPCLEKSENKNARLAVTAINKACRRVQWQSATGSGGKKGFLGGLFATSTSSNGSSSSTDGPCLAKIVLRDSGADGQPELFVDPIQNTDPADGQQQKRQSSGYKLNIKLRRVDKVTLDEVTGQIVLTAKKVGGIGRDAAVAKELLRFTLLQQNDNNNSNHESAAASQLDATAAPIPVTSDVRNTIVHHLMVVSEWERQRRAELQRTDPDGYYSDEEEDEENQPNFLQARAQKAAHFAKREVEMQRVKKERDKRKAELVAESGGLKYTAIAMANMQS